MKKLDILIIKSFIGPFVATFFVTLFVLIMQFFWLWIDEFVGKGLDAGTIFKFIWYQSAVLIPLALPLSVLLSSLMTFGNLGETFELVAIKSAGISLLRFMRPLVFVTLGISFCAVLFANYVIPVAELKSRTLLADIVLAKPAFAIKEGVFYDKLSGFTIKIGKKESDSIIKDVIVFEGEPGYSSLQDNFIVAKSGIMTSSPDKKYLNIVFKDGWRYQERGRRTDSSTDYIRLGFKEYRKQLDISTFNFQASSDSDNNRTNERVLSMRQLNLALDSLQKQKTEDEDRYKRTLLNSFSLLQYKDSVVPEGITIPDSILNFQHNLEAYLAGQPIVSKSAADTSKKTDSVKKALAKTIRNKKDTANKKIVAAITGTTDTALEATIKKDSPVQYTTNTSARKINPKDSTLFKTFIPDSARINVTDRALSSITITKDNTDMNAGSLSEQQKTINRYKNEWHKKLVLAFACFVMFMIGAPLGSIIRKGGLGTPMIFAIIFFTTFFFTSRTGEKMAKEGTLSSFTGMWLSTFILLPVGLFLTYKAMHDSNLFNKEFYNRLRRKITERWKNRKNARQSFPS